MHDHDSWRERFKRLVCRVIGHRVATHEAEPVVSEHFVCLRCGKFGRTYFEREKQ